MGVGGTGLAIEAAALTKVLRRRRVMDGVDLVVPAGQCLVVLGHNGSGKTTLLRLLAGAMPPDAGSLRVFGHDARFEARALRGLVGVDMGDDRSWYWRLSGPANLRFFAALTGLGAGAAGRVEELVELVGLGDAGERRVGEYSSGMRARLGVARALLGRPRALILDEPTRSMDAQGTAAISGLICRLCAEEAVTVVLATHDLEQAAELADQLIVLDTGRVVARPQPHAPAEVLRGIVGGAPGQGTGGSSPGPVPIPGPGRC